MPATLVPATLRGYCGDGEIQVTSGEQCESTDLDGQSCADVGFPAGGTLRCTACRLETSGCRRVCGDGVCQDTERAGTGTGTGAGSGRAGTSG